MDAEALKGFTELPAAAGDTKMELPPVPANFFAKAVYSCWLAGELIC